MSTNEERGVLLGVAAAAASGVAYGAATVVARALARDGLSSATVLTIRFGLAAAVLIAIALATGRTLRPARGELLAALTLGTLGYAFEASLFFAALERGSAAGVTVVFYAYPAIVAVLEVAGGALRPTRRLVVAVLVAGAGTVLVVAAGSDVTLGPAATLFALGAALSFSLYLLASHRWFARTAPLARAAWAAGGASVGVAVHGAASGGFEAPAGHWPLLALVGVTTAAAFGFLFLALGRVLPTQMAVILNVEPVAAVLFGALFLSEQLRGGQLAGTALVLAGAVAVSLPTAPTAADASVPPG